MLAAQKLKGKLIPQILMGKRKKVVLSMTHHRFVYPVNWTEDRLIIFGPGSPIIAPQFLITVITAATGTLISKLACCSYVN